MFVIDYVIVHELAHLIEPHHTPRFWNIVRAQSPTMEKAREWLKRRKGRYWNRRSEGRRTGWLLRFGAVEKWRDHISRVACTRWLGGNRTSRGNCGVVF